MVIYDSNPLHKKFKKFDGQEVAVGIVPQAWEGMLKYNANAGIVSISIGGETTEFRADRIDWIRPGLRSKKGDS